MIRTYSEVREAVQKVIDYNWSDEERDYETQVREEGEAEGHIFTVLQDLDAFFAT